MSKNKWANPSEGFSAWDLIIVDDDSNARGVNLKELDPRLWLAITAYVGEHKPPTGEFLYATTGKDPDYVP